MKSLHFHKFVVCIVLAALCCPRAFAQDRTMAYYNASPWRVLPDARQAFSDSKYDRAVELCNWYYILIGNSAANDLKDKATRCADLSREIESLATSGQNDAAREKALTILKINPDDIKARLMTTTDPDGMESDHGWVDLGLSVKWATCNVGASSMCEYGYYFAWGETSPKKSYNSNYIRYRSGSGRDDIFTKYNTNSRYGTVDNRTRLDLSDDAARDNWGGRWRTPTAADIEELAANCTCTWTSSDGVNGCLLTSKKNGKSVFLPATGYMTGSSVEDGGSAGYYWSSSLSEEFPFNALYISIDSSRSHSVFGRHRYYGLPVRPVLE